MTPAARLALLAKVGRALHGDDWQRAIARDLGPLHPSGAREAIDDRLVRRWVASERPVAEWVPRALVSLLVAAQEEATQRAMDLRDKASLLEAMIERTERA